MTNASSTDYHGHRSKNRRGARFEERFALEALRLGEFARIVTKEIERYWNADHDGGVQDQPTLCATKMDNIVAEVQADHSDEINKVRLRLPG